MLMTLMTAYLSCALRGEAQCVPADLDHSKDECEALQAELAKAHQADRERVEALQTNASQGDGGSSEKLQAEREELNLEMLEASQRSQTARREVMQLKGDLRGKEAELQHYKIQLEE